MKKGTEIRFELPGLEEDVVLTGEAAQRFLDYDANPWAYETKESQKIAERARKIAKEMSESGCSLCGLYCR